jgi:hypothetical protein
MVLVNLTNRQASRVLKYEISEILTFSKFVLVHQPPFRFHNGIAGNRLRVSPVRHTTTSP